MFYDLDQFTLLLVDQMIRWFQAIFYMHKFTYEIVKWKPYHIGSIKKKNLLSSGIGLNVVTNHSHQSYKEMEKKSERSGKINFEPHFDEDEQFHCC